MVKEEPMVGGSEMEQHRCLGEDYDISLIRIKEKLIIIIIHSHSLRGNSKQTANDRWLLEDYTQSEL